MKPIYQQYAKEIKKHLRYHATWEPGTPLKLGDFGVVEDGVFTYMANVGDYGITFDVRNDNTKNSFDYSSGNSVIVTAKLAGEIAPKGSVLKEVDAGFIVEFSKENAFLFKLNRTKAILVENKKKLGDEFIKCYKKENWNEKLIVITELIEAESGTILISSGNESKIELKANAGIGIPGLDIADADLQLSILNDKNVTIKIIAEQGLTPLFNAMGVRKGISSSPKIRYIAPRKAVPDAEAIRFVEIDDLSKW